MFMCVVHTVYNMKDCEPARKKCNRPKQKQKGVRARLTINKSAPPTQDRSRRVSVCPTASDLCTAHGKAGGRTEEWQQRVRCIGLHDDASPNCIAGRLTWWTAGASAGQNEHVAGCVGAAARRPMGRDRLVTGMEERDNRGSVQPGLYRVLRSSRVHVSEIAGRDPIH